MEPTDSRPVAGGVESGCHQMRRRRLGRIRRPAAALLATAALTGGTSMAMDHATAAALPPSQAAWEKLDTLARENSAQGVFLDSQYRPILVLPAGISDAKKASIGARVPSDMKVTVKTSRFTKADIDEIERVVTERKWAPQKDSLSVTYDGSKDKVIVATDAPASATAALLRRYPDALEVQSARFVPQASRFTDVPPFWGGAFLDNGGSSCTAGVHVTGGDGKQYMTTAAHCFDTGNVVWNSDNLTRVVGEVASRYASVDTEVIRGGGFGNSIFIGGYRDSTAALDVGGADNVATGMQVNVSGAVTFQHGGHPVTNINFTYCDRQSCTATNSAFLFARGGSASRPGKMTDSGDSGAPIYFQRNGKAVIVGLHLGREYLNNTEYMVGVKISNVLGALHATLATA